MHCISIINLGIFVQLIHWKFNDYIEFVFTICLNRNTIACLRLSSAILLSSLLSEKRANQYFYRHSSARKRHKKKRTIWLSNALFLLCWEKKTYYQYVCIHVYWAIWMHSWLYICTWLSDKLDYNKVRQYRVSLQYKEKLHKIQP